MSNADDRCARKDCQASRMAHGMHMHPFVEPAPQPEPSGDEAKVREIIIARKKTGESGDYLLIMTATEAYAAGKADGARAALEKDGQWLGDMLLKIFADGWTGAQVAMRDAIARRGSEGK